MKIYKISQNSIISSQDLQFEVEHLHRNYDDIIEGDLLERIGNWDFWIKTTYNIANLDLDEWYVDEDLVEEYVEKMKNNLNYPPIIIDDKSHERVTIVDGIHRANALNQLGHSTVQAYVPHVEGDNA